MGECLVDVDSASVSLLRNNCNIDSSLIRRIRGQNGYSFAEVMISMVIMGIVALLMGTILTTSTKMHRSSFSTDDAYVIAREKLAQFRRSGTSVAQSGTDPVINRNNVAYSRSWELSQPDTTASVKVVVTVAWQLGGISKQISISGYVGCDVCPTIPGNHNPNAGSGDITNNEIKNGKPAGTVIGVVTAYDQDVIPYDDKLLFRLREDGAPHNTNFVLRGDTLCTAVNNLAAGNYNVRILYFDCAATEEFGYDFIVTVADSLFLAPQDLGTIPENSSSGFSVPVAVAAEGTGDIRYSTSSMYFEINESSGELSVKSGAVLDYEANMSTNPVVFTVRATRGSKYVENSMTVYLSDVNEAPTAIIPSSQIFNIQSDATSGDVVFTGFKTEDPDSIAHPNDHYYEVIGSNSGNFYFSGADLYLNKTTVAGGESYSITVRSTDNLGSWGGSGISITEDYIVAVMEDPNINPTGVNLSNQLIADDDTAGHVIGFLSTIDPDNSVPFIYSFDGGVDDNKFTISGNVLKVGSNALDAGSYFIKIKTTDNGAPQGTYAEDFEIVVSYTDPPNQAPTNINLSNNTIDEGESLGFTIGILSTVDPDIGDVHTYSFFGGDDDGLFSISGNVLKTGVLALGWGEYNISIKTTDSSGEYYSKNFTIIVNEVASPSICDNLAPWANTGGRSFGELVTYSNNVYVYGNKYQSGDAVPPGGNWRAAGNCDDCSSGVNTWSVTSYSQGDVVFYDNKIWVAEAYIGWPNPKPDETSNWTKLYDCQ